MSESGLDYGQGWRHALKAIRAVHNNNALHYSEHNPGLGQRSGTLGHSSLQVGHAPILEVPARISRPQMRKIHCG